MPDRGRLVLGALLAASLSSGVVAASAGDRATDEQAFARIERGRYLTVAADCAACHTEPGGAGPFAGGRPIGTPFGSVVAPNITPDPDTGIGNWTDAEFDAALREGRGRGGERLYPAMPYPYYTRMSRSDVLAIRAYLATLPAVRHAVKSDQLPFPFSIRTSMLLWNALYFRPGELRRDPSRPAAWNRGAYLVEGPGHCGACHTPKSSLGGDETRLALAGYSLQGWFAPDITADARLGLGGWSVADIVDYLQRGHNRFAAASGPMAEEVAYSSSLLSPEDLTAIATYLKGAPSGPEGTGGSSPRAATPPASPAAAVRGEGPGERDPRMLAGAAIYTDLCSACHAAGGRGVPYLIPDLAASTAVVARDPTTLLRVVLEGTRTVATTLEPTSPSMPGFGWQLTDPQVAAVITYLRNSWGHHAAVVSANEVRQARERLRARAD